MQEPPFIVPLCEDVLSDPGRTENFPREIKFTAKFAVRNLYTIIPALIVIYLHCV